MDKKKSTTRPPLQSIAEIRRIYSAIFNQKDTPPPKSILITSGSKGEGKTTLACNLAALAAREKGKKVLIIDYNGFSPTVHSQFGIPELSSPHAPGSPFDEIAQVPDMEGLSILTAAAFSRIEAWENNGSHKEMPYFIQEAKARYDQIFIDASAAYPTNHKMNDPITLGKAVDGVILIALTHATPKAKTKKACYALQSCGAAVLGIVANEWKNPLIRQKQS